MWPPASEAPANATAAKAAMSLILFMVWFLSSLSRKPILALTQRQDDPPEVSDKRFRGDSLAEASTFVEVIEKRQGLKVACLEGIAYRNGWISEEKMRELAKPMLKNQYGQYLLKVIDEMKEEVNSRTLTQD